jgi:pilus assembly protein CpaD
MKNLSSSIRRLAFSLTAILLVSACTINETEQWSPQEAPKKNKIDWVTFNHDVGFASPSSSLSKAGRSEISRFLGEIDIGDSDRVFIRAKKGAGNHQVAAVAKYLRKLKLRPEIVIARGAKRPVSVVVGRYLVTTPRCPDWTKQPGLDSANRRSSNFGCATTSNLGLMVADPGDLVQGQTMGPSDGAKGASSVNKYREDKVVKPPTVTLNVQGGS